MNVFAVFAISRKL